MFSRRLDSEARAKAWLGRGELRRNRALAGILIRNAQRIATASGLPVFEIDETRQHGEDFGQRLADAFQQVFALGYRAAIAIGNDCPAIAQTDWQAITVALEAGQAVIGPTSQGGAYLIGLQAAQFSPQAFADLPWQCSATWHSLRSHLLGAGCELQDQLPCLADLNTLADIRHALQAHPKPTGILRLIAALLHPAPAHASVYTRPHAHGRAQRQHLRGPPATAH